MDVKKYQWKQNFNDMYCTYLAVINGIEEVYLVYFSIMA